MFEYPYLQFREEEEAENEKEDMISFLNDDFLKCKKELFEKEDENIYKEKNREKETNVTETEENSICMSNKRNETIVYENNIKVSKRGRKKNSEKNLFTIENKNCEHNKFKSDNIRIKIKTHFHNFILNFFNDFIKSKFTIQRFKFRKISYSITKDVTVKNNLNLMKMTLGNFLSQKLSKKYKCDLNQNKITLNLLLQMLKNENDKNIFKINYSDFYQHFYLSKNKKEIVDKFHLQKRTEFFYDFVQKINHNNYKNCVIDIAENHFINYFSSNTKISQFTFNNANKQNEKTFELEDNKNKELNQNLFLRRKREFDGVNDF